MLPATGGFCRQLRPASPELTPSGIIILVVSQNTRGAASGRTLATQDLRS